MRKKLTAWLISAAMVLSLFAALPVTASALDIPTLTGASVWRSAGDTATVRFSSDEAGTCYYRITDSATPPADMVSGGTDGGVVTADVATTVSLTGLTAGAKYAHIVVEDGAGNVSDVLTVAMPHNIYYFEDFEAYPPGTYIKSNAMSPLAQVNGGTGDENQKVVENVSDPTGKMLSLSSSGGASDQIVSLNRDVLTAAASYTFEGDVYALGTTGWQLRFSVTTGTYSASTEAGVFFKNGNIVSISNGERVLQTGYNANQWYHVKIVAFPSAGKYSVYLDGELLDDTLTLPANINRLAITSGHNYTAYYDNLEFYLDPLFSGGSGSEAAPYLISSEEDLVALSQLSAAGNTFAGKYFEQTCDIALTQDWTPIKDFRGIYDGQTKTVSNLTNDSHADYIGFFGKTGAGAQLKDIVLDGVTFTDGWLYVGALVGYSEGSSISGCAAHDIDITGDSYVGGLVGYAYPAHISGCHADGALAGSESTGGLVGETDGSSITDSSAAVNITGDDDAGGLVGYNYSCSITSSYAAGDVEGNYHVGGLVGYNDYYAAITGCYATGNVSRLSEEFDYFGGLVGCNDYHSTVTKCYSTGDVTGNDSVGGLAGYSNDNGCSITQCYTTGVVTGNEDTGPLVGENYGTLSSCYYLDKTGEDTSSSALTAAEMAQQASFGGWDFAGTWEIGLDGAYAFPTLGLGGAIHSSASAGGSISPEGWVTLSPGGGQVYAIAPDGGYSIADVAVNGESLGAITSYTFADVQTSHKISASFEATASADAGLTGVLTKTVTAGAEAGTAAEPKTASIYVDNTVSAVASSDITPAAGATADFYGTDGAFTTAETGSVPLAAGDTTVYIKVTAEDGATVLHYAVTVSRFGGGNGSTRALAYEISTANQLSCLAGSVNAGEPYSGKYFVLTADIDLADAAWTPIGTESNPFSGSFDGGGHAVEGLNINGGAYQYAGLFGYADGAAFENLTVDGTVTNTCSGSYCFAGGVVAYAENTRIDNCGNKAAVTVSASSALNINGYAGGIAGYLNAGSAAGDVTLAVTGCGNEGAVTARATQTSSSAYAYTYAGGIAGCFNSRFDAGAIAFTITQCTNSGSVEAAGAAPATYAQGRAYAGGIIAAANLGDDGDGTLTIADCLNTGAVSTDANAYYATCYAGGIAAELVVNKDDGDAVMTIESCRNSAGVTALAGSGSGDHANATCYLGGIAGYAYTSADYDSTLTVSDCVNSGAALTASSSGYASARTTAGGIVGHADAYSYESDVSGSLIIKGCANRAQITATAEQTNIGASMHNTRCYAGGVAGDTSDIATIMSCYNRGGVAALGNSNDYAGGIEGYADETANILSCYSTGAITSSGDSAANTGGVAGYLYEGEASGCYWLTGTAAAAVGTGSRTAADASCAEKTSAELQSSTFVAVLNTAADAGAALYVLSDMPVWEQAPDLETNGGYPVLSWPEPSGGETGGTSGGSSPSTPSTPTYHAGVQAGDSADTLPVTVNQNAGTASVDTGSGQLTSVGTVVTMPQIPNVSTYSVGIPVPDLSTAGVLGTLTLNTGAGSITVPSNMLTDAVGVDGNKALITIGEGDKESLPDEVKAAIGDKPLVSLTLSIDGEQTDWNNPNAPVTVSIPYTPTAAELLNPESIVVWYIDGSGNVVTIPNGRYDEMTGTVTFSTTHFSDYAVAFNKMSFGDVADTAWYYDAVSFIAAREITTGTGGGNYSPEAKLTRGQFIVMLMRAYGIEPDSNGTDNFSDAGNTYYTGYLAAAKRLGISNGVGDNMYAPGKEITRQEMFTLLHNALKVIGQLPQGNSGKKLSDFSDAADIAAWAKEAMSLLVETGTVSGSGGKLNPTGTSTRAEMAQVLYNLLSK